MKAKLRLSASLLLVLFLLAVNPFWVDAASVITLERALEMARSQGEAMLQLDLGSEQASLSLDMMRREFGLGAVGVSDSKTLKKNMQAMESLIDERVTAIRLLEENIAGWEEQKASLDSDEAQEDSPSSGELDILIREAEREKTDYQLELDEIRFAYSKVVQRYYPMKAQEDLADANPNMQSIQSAVDATSDAQLIQPRVISYNVERLYLSLQELGAQQNHLKDTVSNLQKMVRREKIMLDLGMTTALSLATTEEAVYQTEEGVKNLQNTGEELSASFRRLLGLPLDFSFTLYPAEMTADLIDVAGITPPDLTQSILYKRAQANVQEKMENLEDTSKSDLRKYRLAELEVEEEELNMETTLKDLQTNYTNSLNALLLAQKTLENTRIGLENARETLDQAELKYRVGSIAGAELEQIELAYDKAVLDYQNASDQHYLAYQAYRLAREGISANESKEM